MTSHQRSQSSSRARQARPPAPPPSLFRSSSSHSSTASTRNIIHPPPHPTSGYPYHPSTYPRPPTQPHSHPLSMGPPPLSQPTTSLWWRTGPEISYRQPNPLPPLQPLITTSPARPLPDPGPEHPVPLPPLRPPTALPLPLGRPFASARPMYAEEGTSSQQTTPRRISEGSLSRTGFSGRHPTACTTCKKRKERCDSGRPCQRCGQRGVGDSCTYRRINEPKSKRPRSDSVESDRSTSPLRPDSTPMARYALPAERSATRSSRSPSRLVSPLTARGRSIYSVTRTISSKPGHGPYSLPTSDIRSTPLLPTSRATTPGRMPHLLLDLVEHQGQSSSGGPSGTGSAVEADELMEEDEVAGIGSRRRNEGGDGLEEEKVFFGTSHFGPQMAAKVVRGNPAVPLCDVRLLPHRGSSLIDDSKPYTLVTQIREMLRLLPRKERCDTYVRAFFEHYNDHTDIIYEPEFMRKYSTFWNTSIDHNKMSQLDLRQIALLFIVLAFGVLLDYPAPKSQMHTPRPDAMASQPKKRVKPEVVDPVSELTQMEREEMSLTWSWAAKRALSEAGRFHGESLDTVRAGTMIALYFIICRRVPEGWTAVGEAIRAAYAQGLHIDGSSWSTMPTGEAELRRRLWAQIYALDRSISLFLGRPSGIQAEFTTREPSNITDDELPWSNPSSIPRPLSTPTKSTFLILHLQLAKIIDYTQSRCFGLRARSYEDVQECEARFAAFAAGLPPHFRLRDEEVDMAFDSTPGYTWLRPQRLSLTSKFHLARISLHRPYLLRSFKKGGAYLSSLEACVSSSVEEIVLRTRADVYDPLDRFKWMTVASGFNPAAIIGIICALRLKSDKFSRTNLLCLLQDYIAAEERTARKDETLEAELVVLRMMLDMGRRRNNSSSQDRAGATPRAAVPTGENMPSGVSPIKSVGEAMASTSEMPLSHADEWMTTPPWDLTSDQFPGDAEAWLKMFAESAERDLSGGFGLGALMLGDGWEESPISIDEDMSAGR